MNITAIIPAAGSGSRFSNVKNKLLEKINEIPVIIRTLKLISAIEEVNHIIIPTSEDLIEQINELIKLYEIPKIAKIIPGGITRQQSVYFAISATEDFKPDFILIHDAARPLISKEIIENAINAAKINNAAIVAVPTKDTIKRVNKNSMQVIQTLNREELWNVQTPQIFKYKDILNSHLEFINENFTDDSAMIEKSCIPVTVVPGDYNNIKITTLKDIKIAEFLLNNKC